MDALQSEDCTTGGGMRVGFAPPSHSPYTFCSHQIYACSTERKVSLMKTIVAFSLIVITGLSPLLAQQKLNRRPGNFYVLGPARSLRIEMP